MVRRLTLGFKKAVCCHCDHADKRALRQGRPYCDSSYKPKNGHCANMLKGAKREKVPALQS